MIITIFFKHAKLLPTTCRNRTQTLSSRHLTIPYRVLIQENKLEILRAKLKFGTVTQEAVQISPKKKSQRIARGLCELWAKFKMATSRCVDNINYWNHWQMVMCNTTFLWFLMMRNLFLGLFLWFKLCLTFKSKMAASRHVNNLNSEYMLFQYIIVLFLNFRVGSVTQEASQITQKKVPDNMVWASYGPNSRWPPVMIWKIQLLPPGHTAMCNTTFPCFFRMTNPFLTLF